MNKYLSFSQVLKLISTVGHKRTIIVEGENGIGKRTAFDEYRVQSRGGKASS